MYISLTLILLCVLSCSAQSHFSKILLQNEEKIVLRDGQMTNARRVSPIPQLRCMGGSAGCRSTPTPNLVICSNIGSQGGEVRWECEADFDQRYRFGRIQVSCEGYEYPDDPYILKDSCGLEYEIDYEHSHSAYHQDYYSSDHSSWFSLTNIILFVAIGILIYAIYKNSLDQRGTDTTTGTHTDYTTPPPTTATGGAVPGATGGWGNFMSGMFIGGFATSIFNMFSSMFRPRHGYGYGYGSGYRSGYGHHGSSWGGGARRGYGGGWGTGGGSWGGSGGGGWGSSGGGSTSRKSAFGGTSKR